MTSIANRIRKTYILMSFYTISVMVAIVLLLNEELEKATLDRNFSEEKEFVASHYGLESPYAWEAGDIDIVFVPANYSDSVALPSIFDGLGFPFMGEVEKNDHTYLVNIGGESAGKFYIAKDISRLEAREMIFDGVLLLVSLLTLGGSLILSQVSSRRIIRPLRDLARSIKGTAVKENMPRLQTKYSDCELQAIADVFNQFLNELETFIKREQAFVNLASHELRTPIAVITGALDVLERRAQLQEKDAATLMRIRQANKEMERNVKVLLMMAQKSEEGEGRQVVSIPGLVEEVLEDLYEDYPVYTRVDLEITRKVTLSTNSVMAKMIIRNIVQNALQHTDDNIVIHITPEKIAVTDAGSGLAPELLDALSNGRELTHYRSGLNGFGLYIVSIMCSRLGWRLTAENHSDAGSTMSVIYA
ncbi:HAMP domain-containing histidine kinase [Hahella sp. HN01]|nr:HAMP domain-containing histidine kinase [Hahella sp. HN01]